MHIKHVNHVALVNFVIILSLNQLQGNDNTQVPVFNLTIKAALKFITLSARIQ